MGGRETERRGGKGGREEMGGREMERRGEERRGEGLDKESRE